MFRSNNFNRRLTLSWKDGSLTADVGRCNRWRFFVVMFAAHTAGFLLIGYSVVSSLVHKRWSADGWYAVGFLAVLILWYAVAVQPPAWRGFGVEEIVVGGGMLRWSYVALILRNKFAISARDITVVRAKRVWYESGYRVELIAGRRRRVIAYMLLEAESAELADALKRAVAIAQ